MRVALRWTLISAAYFYASIAVAIAYLSYRSGLLDLSSAAWCGLTWPVWARGWIP